MLVFRSVSSKKGLFNPTACLRQGRYQVPTPKDRSKKRKTDLVLPNFSTMIQKEDDFSLLHAASFNGWTELVKRLLEGPDSDPNQTTMRGKFTPLFGAVANNSIGVVKLLLSHGANTSIKDVAGRSPIHSASDSGFVEILQLLLDKNPESSRFTTNQGRTPLHYSAARDHVEAGRLLLQYGADVHATTVDGRQCLHMSAQNDAVGITTLLLEHGADVNCVSRQDWSPLHVAAEHDARQVTKLLVDRGANIFFPNSGGWTPFHISSTRGDIHVVKHALEVGSAAEKSAVTTRGWTSLMVAAQKGDAEMVKLLWQGGVSTENQTIDGWTANHIAVDENNDAVLEFLLSVGATHNKSTSHGMTALSLAVRRGRTQSVRLLLRYGADWEQPNRGGWCPIHVGAQQGEHEIIRLLVEAGAQTEVATPDGRRPLHLAAESGHSSIVELLLQSGVDVDPKNCVGQTPLHRAASSGALEVVMVLLQYNADANAISKSKYTAVDYAQQGGHQEVATYLRNCGGYRGRRARTKKGVVVHKKLQGKGGRNENDIRVDAFNQMAREHNIHFDILLGVRPKVSLSVRWEFSDWLHLALGRTEGNLNDTELQLRAYTMATQISSSTHRKLDETTLPLATPHQFRLGTEGLSKLWQGRYGLSEHRDRIEALDGRVVLHLTMPEDEIDTNAKYHAKIAWKCDWTTVEEVQSIPIHVLGQDARGHHENEFTAPVLPTLIRQVGKAVNRMLIKLEKDEEERSEAELALSTGTRNRLDWLFSG